jgi:hypothetical protein
MTMDAIGRKLWAIAEGHIPSQSSFTDRDLISHEAACILNAGGIDAHVTITLEIDLTMLAEGREQNSGRLRLCCGAFRGGNADKPQTLPLPPRQRLDRKGGGRSAAEPDHHIILDQLHRCLGGRALERVAITVGRGRSGVHDVTAAAAALARMSAIALA